MSALSPIRGRPIAEASVMADLPDPEDYAQYLELDIAEALLAAEKSQSYGWLVPVEFEALLPRMRRLGLVGFGDPRRDGRGVTAFGWKVRTVLVRHEREMME